MTLANLVFSCSWKENSYELHYILQIFPPTYGRRVTGLIIKVLRITMVLDLCPVFLLLLNITLQCAICKAEQGTATDWAQVGEMVGLV